MPRFEVPHIELPRIATPDMSRLIAQTIGFQDAIHESLSRVFEQLRETFRDLPPRIQKALLVLGAHGWYLDLDMPLPGLWELEKGLLDGDVAEAEEALCGYFESRLDEIEESITARSPGRAHLVRAACGAHRRGEYALSIPVLLAQTDGICREVTKHYLFRRRDKRPQTAAYVEQVAADSLRAAILSPLAETLPISASERERQDGSYTLNRHEVFHGDCLDYGTRTNGLKAISLLNYVVTVLRDDAGGNL